MALVLKFVRGLTEVSLQDGLAGLQLADGWRPNVQIPVPGGPAAPVVESLPVIVRGSSHDDLATHVQALHEMQYWAGLYLADRMEQTPVWLHAQLYNESNERRALVYSIETTFDTGWYEAESAYYEQSMMIAATRGPWEATAALADNGILEESAGACLVMDYTYGANGDVVGDIPARINKFEIATAYDVAALDQYDRFWVGLRSARRHSDLDLFVPVWECEAPDADLGIDAALVQDPDASPALPTGDTKITITPGTATWARRLTIDLGDVTRDFAANYGRFLALLRAQISEGAWEAQLKFAYYGGVVAAEGPIVEIDELGWDIYEMGQHSIPLRDLHALPIALIPDQAEEFYQVQIWARRTAGEGTLDLDCIIMLPIDEGYAVVKGADMDFDLPASNSAYLAIGCSPEDTFQAVATQPDYQGVQVVPQLTTGNFYLPPGDGRAYIVFAGPYVSKITDMISANVLWTPRWLSLRGAE